ncbi:hypothetical protein, unlikely [Trypanosoma brucei gambiense DAL972]|uniref:Uncharacterized protein n=1 Tax=Trypanosoma brucei gambiense (strain MHOM/CI/86/DAL972) TaxID=679716 RepID=D0A3G1_TRYB9|nr:hypothetical protein, unlikely [Trypanosoma brucei gambiense DAL972]CBH15805.1 hypothetical protein, unlikely [Trypanosoma brucei gambiense DAL972]|eukprot:XP_011778069.1 hypothetical protein, unlikely [Trypanosoma brucei gambiense DAL972]
MERPFVRHLTPRNTALSSAHSNTPTYSVCGKGGMGERERENKKERKEKRELRPARGAPVRFREFSGCRSHIGELNACHLTPLWWCHSYPNMNSTCVRSTPRSRRLG